MTSHEMMTARIEDTVKELNRVEAFSGGLLERLYRWMIDIVRWQDAAGSRRPSTIKIPGDLGGLAELLGMEDNEKNTEALHRALDFMNYFNVKIPRVEIHGLVMHNHYPEDGLRIMFSPPYDTQMERPKYGMHTNMSKVSVRKRV